MPGSSEGLAFLLRPDFSKVDGKVVLDAMGQAFFSMSVGMGCLCTYASYFTRDANLVKTAGSVALIDTFVAVLAGFIIFSGSLFCSGAVARCRSGIGVCHFAQCVPVGFQECTVGGLYLLAHVLRIVGVGSADFHHFFA